MNDSFNFIKSTIIREGNFHEHMKNFSKLTVDVLNGKIKEHNTSLGKNRKWFKPECDDLKAIIENLCDTIFDAYCS